MYNNAHPHTSIAATNFLEKWKLLCVKQSYHIALTSINAISGFSNYWREVYAATIWNQLKMSWMVLWKSSIRSLPLAFSMSWITWESTAIQSSRWMVTMSPNDDCLLIFFLWPLTINCTIYDTFCLWCKLIDFCSSIHHTALFWAWKIVWYSETSWHKMAIFSTTMQYMLLMISIKNIEKLFINKKVTPWNYGMTKVLMNSNKKI
jgi:hypothetical protein